MNPTNKRPSKPGTARNDRTNNRAEQRHQKESQVAQLSAANVEESPHMDRGESEGGSGESLPAGQTQRAGEQHKRGAVDAQYGTKSDAKSAADRTAPSKSSAEGPRSQTPNPESSEESSGTERDTMSGPRPGSGG
jgi:hypothetical protein